MIQRSSLRIALLCAAFAFACKTTQLTSSIPGASKSTPQQQLSAAERRAEAGASAANLGKAALAAYVITGNPERATAWADKALAKDPGEPAALYTHALMAREALDEVGLTKWSLEILKRAPKSRFTELAALRLQEIVQTSPTTDQMILDSLGGLGSASLGLEGKPAALAREVVAAVLDGRNDAAGVTAMRAAIGSPFAWTVVGPLEPTRLNDFDKPSPFDDPKHVLASTYHGSAGDVAPRVLPTAGGVLDLDSDPWRGDIYEALADVDAKKGGNYLVSLRGMTEARLYVDGVEVARRTAYPQRSPERTWSGVELPQGPHRIRLRASRVEGSWAALSLAREDGAPSDLSFHAPPVGSAPPAATAHRIEGAGRDLVGDASDGQLAVEWFLRVQAEAGSDGEQARADLDALVAAAGESPAVRSLRADLNASDPDVPRGTAISRVTQDLDAIIAEQPNDARAQLARFDQERNDKRFDDAEKRLQKLDALLTAKNARLWMLKARLSLDRSDEASASKDAETALTLDHGRCDALDFRLGLARRNLEVSVIDKLTPELMTCPGGVDANASYFRLRGKLAEAKKLLEAQVTRNPTAFVPRRSLSDVLFAMGDLQGAVATTEAWDTFWPQRNDGLKRLAAIYATSGDEVRADELAKRALALDQSDLSLARSLKIGTNTDAMSWADRDGLAAIEQFKKANYQSTASAVQVLDLGGLEIEPDGSARELVHSIVQVLDKKAIDQYGEVSLPGDAQPLVIRTVKADGTILDAETIAGKESISLPNLEPGDFVEYAFLKSSGPRPPGIPGWQGGQFMFQGEDTPFFESTYTVRAPASIGMELDSGNLPEPAKVVRDGDTVTMTYTRKGMAPFIREPMAPSDAEVLPWLEVGSGATQMDMVRQLGDWLAVRLRTTGEAFEFVREFEKMPVADRPKAIVDKLRNEIRGDSNTFEFSESAAAILAQSRGNRMLALKAALAAAGIPSHIVIARPFSSNPHQFRFPHMDLYTSALLRIEPPGSAPMWMDFGLRLAPFNRIPPNLSEADAYVLPEPGEEPQHITLPKVDPTLDRTDTDLSLALDADGTLTGTVTQTAYGFDAAGARRRLEQVDRAQLMKQMERALNGTFRGVVLTDFQLNDSSDPEKPVSAVSTIRVPYFGQRADGSVALVSNFGAARMGQRFITRSERQTPLLLSSDDYSKLNVTLKLPPKAKLDVLPPVDVQTPFGHFKATWQLANDTLSYKEELSLNRARILPAQYADFRAFAEAVDAAQQREMPLASL